MNNTPNYNETQQQMYTPKPNLQLDNQRNPVYPPPPQPVPVAYQAVQPVVVQAAAPQPNVVIIQEEKKRLHSDNCCYCPAPRTSACGCLEPNEYYCCFLIVGNYILLSLKYILTCLCIVRLGQSIC